MTFSLYGRPSISVIAILAALTVIRLIFAANIDFIEDEAYYRLWGLFPSFAYFDHAPMVGWWIALGQGMLGDTHLGLRVLSPLASLLGSLVLWRCAWLLAEPAHAYLVVFVFNAMTLIGVGSVLMTPDVPSVFFWGLALMTLLEWHHSGRRIWWIAFGFAAGLGLLSKYTNGFLGIGVLLWLGLSGRWRDAIRAPQFWIAGILACLIFAPVLIWNAQHEFISFTRQFSRLEPHDFTLRYLGEWVAGQAMLISPIMFLLFGVTLVKLRSIRTDMTSATSLVVITAIPILFYFLFHVFTSRINANWTAPIYPNIALLISPLIVTLNANKRTIWRHAANLAVPTGFLLSILVLIEAWHPILPPDPRNPMSQMRGFGAFAEDILQQQQAEKLSAIVTSRYQLTSLLDYQLRGKSKIVQVTERIRFLNQPQSRSVIPDGTAMYVARDSEAIAFIEQYRTCFSKAEFVRKLERFDRGALLETYQLWRLEGLNSHLLDRGLAADCSQ